MLLNRSQPLLKPVALAALSLFTLTAPVLAQTTGTPAVPAPDEGGKLETVVVTAQRRLERLQDVPVAVKAFSAKQIDSMGIGSTQDFINLTPNMSFDNSFTYGNSFVVLRGVTQINNADSPVAVVVDGVPQNNQKQLKMNLFDIERIEVLKGPQGALYGRNAIGGAINIETRKPTNAFEGFAGLELGSGNLREVTAGISGPLAQDTALFRLVAQTKASDGTIGNAYTGAKVDAVDHDNSVRGKLLLTPTVGLQLDLRLNLVDFAAGATYDSIVTKPSIIVQPDENMLGRTTGRTADYSAKVQYEMPWAMLTSITGYTDLKENYRGDLDFTNPVTRPGLGSAASQIGQGQNLGVRMTSQELRLTSPDSQPVRWIGGVYYLNTKRDLETRVFRDTNGSNDQWDDMSKNIVRLNESNDNTASAVFGQLDVDLAKQWTLSTALRYDSDKRHQNDLLGGTSREAEFSKWQPKLTLTHTLDANALLYGTLSTGFRSGGFNAPGIGNYKPETLTNAEMGMKTTLMGGRLLFNAAVFASKSDNFQFFYIDVKSGSQIISNIDSVDLRGLDLDFRYLPMKGLEFDGGLGITDSTITRDAAEPGAVGNHTPKTTPFKINLGAQYSTALGNGMVGTLRLDYEHRDSKYWHPDNAAVSPPLDLLGVRATVADAKDKWSVTLAVRNLTDQRYYTDYTSKKYTGLGYDIGFLAPGRLVSLEAKTRF